MEQPKVTIARSGVIRKLSTSTEFDLLFYNPIDNLQIAMIRFDNLAFTAGVQSTPRLENLHPLFQNYKQKIEIYAPGKANITLIADTVNVPVIGSGTLIPVMATLKCDRTLNGEPVSWGNNSLESFIVSMVVVPSQIYF